MITGWLINGLILASMFILVTWLLARWTRDVVGWALLALVLIGAALAYVYYAARAGESPGWLAAELVGVGVYGSLAVRGVLRSPLWLAAGWALHPVWDLALHYFGPGHTFAPDYYAVTCLSFDLLVAVYVALAYRRSATTNSAETPFRPVTATRPARSGRH